MKTKAAVVPEINKLSISPATLIFENKCLLGSFVGSIHPRVDLPKLVNLYRAGSLPDITLLLLSKSYFLPRIYANFTN